MSIYLFMPTYRVDECLQEIRKCLESGWTGLGFKTVDFENAWKEYTGHQFAHFLNSATAGLHLGIKLLKMKYRWKDGDEVISTPLTFVSTNHAILYENLKVVFADVDEYLCLDPVDVEKKITDRTKAVVFVGFGGNTGRLEDVAQLCKKHSLALILDAAHMAGTRLNGKCPGLLADVAVYSFHAVKNLPTADSGMICFSDGELDALCRKFSWMGINKDTYMRSISSGTAYKWEYDVEYVGYKYHGNSIMAAIGLVQLRHLDIDNAYRRQIASWYDEIFKNHEDKVHRVPIAPGCESSRHLYPILVHNRDELLLALHGCEIYPGVHYKENTAYRMYRSESNSCPRATEVSKSIMSLPMHLRLTYDDVKFVGETVLKYAKG